MYSVIFVGTLLAIVAIVLVVIVLLQNPKGEGGGSMLSGNNQVQKVVGIAQISNLLQRATYVIFGFLIFLTLIFSSVLNQYYNG